MMARLLPFLLLVLFSSSGAAQVAHGGVPMDWGRAVDITSIPSFTMAPIDVEALRAEDERIDIEKSAPYRFGATEQVDIDLLTESSLSIRPNGDRIYRYAVHSNGALSLSFLLSDFHIPEGGRLYLWNGDRTDFLGSFTHENNKEGGMFPIGTLQGETVVFEYHLAADAGETSSLHLIETVHAYRPILNKWSLRGPFGNSGDCNINVLCPVGLPYIDQTRSVALIVSGNSAVCSGAMLANAEGDATPYLLTANHCLNSGDPTSWLYYFQHQSETCTGDTGPTNLSVANADELFSSSSSDVLLLRLSTTPPEDYEVFYAGWNSSTASNVTSSAYSIHHPSGDVKKICFEDDSPFFYTTSGGTSTWRIAQWESGVTEAGSSGGPLFDENDRIIGQLFGGTAACSGTGTNGGYDVYGRFGVSYPSLQAWLDPMGTDSVTLTGYYPFSTPAPFLPPDSVTFDAYIAPTINNGQFSLTLNELKDVDVSVFDMGGRTVWRSALSGDFVYRLDLRDILRKGLYIVRIDSDEGSVVRRMATDRD